MNIHKATRNDQNDLLSLVISFQQYLDEENGVAYRPPEDKKKQIMIQVIEDVLSSEHHVIYIATDGDTPVGFIYLALIPNIRRGYSYGLVQDLFVIDSQRGKGIGKALFQKAKEYCTENSIPTIKLTSDLSLADAHQFYESQGGTFTEKAFRFDL
jgi:GNAT superfamily N-acetyltransferase